jgi:hypothetical protein
MAETAPGATTPVSEGDAGHEGPPSGFRLPTPGNWFDLDLDPRTRNQSIAQLVDSRLGGDPTLGRRRDEMVRLLRRVAREAAEHNALFASMLSELVENQPMAAGVNVTVAPITVDRGATAVNDPRAVQAALGEASHDPAADGERPEVRLVQLAAGPAVRVSGMRSTQLPGGGDQSLLTSEVQYFLPVPGSSLMAVITFSTPTVALADRFAELFDAMAAGFEFFWDGAGGVTAAGSS